MEDGQDEDGNIDSTGDLVANLGPMTSKVFDKLCLGKLKLEFSTSIHSVKYVLWQLCAAMMSWVRRWVELVVY